MKVLADPGRSGVIPYSTLKSSHKFWGQPLSPKFLDLALRGEGGFGWLRMGERVFTGIFTFSSSESRSSSFASDSPVLATVRYSRVEGVRVRV